MILLTDQQIMFLQKKITIFAENGGIKVAV
jgi:hypothetical protein